jgi:NAD(P)H-flavin reductase
MSVASIHEENIIKIGTKIPASSSPWKQKLRSLKAGETINIRGPFGWFKIQDETSPVVMVAG